MVGLCYRRKLRGTREASNGGRMRVRIIHGLNISHKELIFLLQKFRSHQKFKYYVHAPRGIDWQEKTITRPRPPLIRNTIKETPHASNLLHNGYHTCMLRDLQTSTQVFLQSTITHQLDSNITISISQNYCKESNISYSVICKFYVGFYD